MNSDLSLATPTAANNAAIDFNMIKQRQQATWASGNYGTIGVTLQIVGEQLAESADVRAGERVLDVAAGNGNATLAAARRFAQVVSTDYVSHLLDQGAARARSEGLAVEFQVEDAEDLSFADSQFDVALSSFGVMFTPQHTRSADELLRVVRRGGRIGLANWTPESFIGQLFRVIAGQVPPPAGLASPMLWGTEPHIVKLFGREAQDIQSTRRQYMFRYHSPEHWLEVFRSYYGPMHKAFAALDAQRQQRLSEEVLALLRRLNTGGPDSLVIPCEYLEVVITKQ